MSGIEKFAKTILEATKASNFSVTQEIQDLWSGYGKILRLETDSSLYPTVVVKHVRIPNKNNHPRGWNTCLSNKRKVRSYQVESAFYDQYAHLCNEAVIPKSLAHNNKNGEVLIVLEDLDSIGYPKRKSSADWTEMQPCISWLADFHATYLEQKPTNLWKVGTYWHLDTRPDELKVLTDTRLKKAARAIDEKLRHANYQTFVHGDAKLANFCFSHNGKSVAAVDFQYVGGGCGMKDLAYFVGSCLFEDQCEKFEEEILEYYFKELKSALIRQDSNVDFTLLETEWRELYHFAWADFHRFMKGWSPGHWKINSYSEKVTRKVIETVND